MMNAPEHRNYRSLSEDPTEIPIGTDNDVADWVVGLYTPWNVGVPNFITPELLREEIYMDLGVKFCGCIGVMVDKPGQPGGVLQVLHGVAKHTPRDAQRGKTYAYVDDVRGIDVNIVELNLGLLERTTPHRVADTVDTQLELFANDEAFNLVPAHDDAALRTRLVTTRKSMLIPFPLVQYVIGRNLSPKEALTTLVPVVRSLDLELACAPLFDFLLVASTGTADAPFKPLTVQPSIGNAPEDHTAVAAPRRDLILYPQLPSLRQRGDQRSDPALLSIANSIRESRNANLDDLADRRHEREQAKKVRTVEERWPDQYDQLLKLCDAETPEQLPDYWHGAAAWKKGSGSTVRSILQDATELAAQELRVTKPLITVQHANTVQNFLFEGTTESNLGTGLLPFTVTPPGAVSLEASIRHDQDYEQTADYTTIMDSNTIMTATDARALRGGGTYVPCDVDEAEIILESYGALLGAVLGVKHAVITSHFAALEAYKHVRLHLKKRMTDVYGPKMAAATLLYYFQSRYKDWFRRQWAMSNTATLPPPSLSAGFESYAVSYTLNWLPDTNHLPLLQRLNRLDRPGENLPSGETSGSAGGQSSRRENSASTDNANPSPARQRVRNRNRDTRLVGQKPIANRIRNTTVREAIEKAGEPPPGDGVTDRCLSYHLKGSCYADCPRAADHHPLEDDAKEKLYEWCILAYPE